MPEADRPNPFLTTTYSRAAVEKYALRKTFKGHKMAVSRYLTHTHTHTRRMA